MESLAPPPVESRFSLDAVIGRGAFAEVFRGVDRETGRPVAIKRLHAHRTDAITAERFRMEARLLASVESPHVVRYVAHGNDGNEQLWVVLEWLEGMDVSRQQKVHPLACDEAVEVVRQAALGLAALHEAGIVHRDVKPSNFMLTARPGGALHVTLLDLGIARAATEPTLTRAGFRIGTPAYMSPEQARGDEGVTAQSDLFSLGVVLYELLAGRRPFTGNDPYTMLAKIVLEDPPPLRSIVPTIPTELEAIVVRAMAKAPEHRFASAREMAAALSLAPTVPIRLPSQPPLAGFDPDVHVASHTVLNAGGLLDALGLHESMATLADETPTTVVRGTGDAGLAEQRVAVAVFAGIDEGDAFAQQLGAFTMLVAAHGGVTHRTLGGRAIAVFGTERDGDEDVLRAARAASAAVRVLPAARLAIATCRVRSHSAGLSGEAIERGATLLDRAQGGRAIAVDDTAARLLAAHFRVVGPEHRQFLLAAHDDAPWQHEPIGLRLATVGRENELAELDATLASCMRERVAKPLLVTAPAGAGRSRLVADFVRSVRARWPGDEQVVVWTARADAIRTGASFGLLAQLVREAAGVQSGEPVIVRQQKVRALADRCVARVQLDRISEFLAEVIGAPLRDGRSVELQAARTDPVLMGDQIRRAFSDWLAAECAMRTVLLVLEDLSWADVATVRALDGALGALAHAPCMVLATARPEIHDVFPDLWSTRGACSVHLAELSRDASEQLIRQALGEEVAPDLVARLVDRAGGNAFYLEELARAVAAGRGDALPDTVLATVQSRLDALDEPSARLLRAASVFGQTSWRGGLVAVLRDARTEALDHRLASLVDADVIVRRSASRFPGEDEYAFRHALLREAAHATLTDEDRQRAHRLAARWLEENGETEAAVLAEHYERGGEPARAVGAYRDAAAQALEGNDFAAVIARCERGAACALDAANQHADGSDGEAVAPLDEAVGVLRLLEAEARRWCGQSHEAEVCATEAMARLPRAGAHWYAAAGELASAAGANGSVAALAALAEELAALGTEGQIGSVHVTTVARAVVQLDACGLGEAADRLLDRCEAVARRIARREPAVAGWLYHARASQALRAGDPAAHIKLCETSVASFEQAGDARHARGPMRDAARGYASLGAYPEAERVARDLLELADGLGLVNEAANARWLLARAQSRRGAYESARALLDASIVSLSAQADAPGLAAAHIERAWLLLATGDTEGAARDASSAADGVTGRARRDALVLVARAALAAGRVPDAVQKLLEADDAARAIEVNADAIELAQGDAIARLTRAEVLWADGHADAARDAIADARDALALRAARMSDPELRESLLHAVPEHARTLRLAEAWLADHPRGASPVHA